MSGKIGETTVGFFLMSVEVDGHLYFGFWILDFGLTEFWILGLPKIESFRHSMTSTNV
jgi:hypothetical protein